MDRIEDLVNPDLPVGERGRIELNAHRVLLRAEDIHLGHAADHRDTLGEDILRVLVNGGKRQGLRAQGELENGNVGGVDLVIGWWGGHIRWKLSRGPGDHGLDVLSGGVDVPAQIELQRNLGPSQGIR